MKRHSSLFQRILSRIHKLLHRSIILLIRGYQLFISPYLPPSCGFYPSCSQYALEAYQRFGVLKGTCLSLIRLSKCHPFHVGGCDLVPEKLPHHYD